MLSKKRNKSGFTLIEVLIAATIFAIIAAALMSSFTVGVKIWSRAEKSDIAASDLALDLEIVARDLRQSVYIEQIGFEGDGNQVSFLSFIAQVPYKVTYKFDSSRKLLMRKQEELESAFSEDAQKKYSEKSIAELDDFQLSYFYFDKEEQEYLWKDKWEKPEKVFSAIKITAKLKNEELSKTIFMFTQ